MKNEINLFEAQSRQYKHEIQAVKTLGDQIGYGNMIDIACSLWRNMLEKSGVTKGGAIFVASMNDLKKRDRKRIEKERERKDEQIIELLDSEIVATPRTPSTICLDLLLKILQDLPQPTIERIGEQLKVPIHTENGIECLLFTSGYNEKHEVTWILEL